MVIFSTFLHYFKYLNLLINIRYIINIDEKFCAFIFTNFSSLQHLKCFTGSDGTLEINNKTKDQMLRLRIVLKLGNRAIFSFNQGLDSFFKPIGYRYLPNHRFRNGNALI